MQATKTKESEDVDDRESHGPARESNPMKCEKLGRAFSEQLLACLDECARGRKGFSRKI